MKQIFIIIALLMLISCSPSKVISKSSGEHKVEYVASSNDFSVLNSKIDIISEKLTTFTEQVKEKATQNVNYTEVNYDSLGRKIREVTQVSQQQSHRNIDTKQTENIYIGLTVEQVDSIMSIRLEQLKAEAESKFAQTVKDSNRMLWWVLGVASVLLIALLVCLGVLYIKSKKFW